MNVRTVLIFYILTFLPGKAQAQTIQGVECTLIDAGSGVNEIWTPTLSAAPLSDSRTLKVGCRDNSGFNSNIHVCFNVAAAGSDTFHGRALTAQSYVNHALTYTLTASSNQLVIGSPGTASSTISLPLSLTNNWTELDFLYTFSLNEGQQNTIVPDIYTGNWQFLIQHSALSGCPDGASTTINRPIIPASVRVLSSCDLTTRPMTFRTTFAGSNEPVTAESSLDVWCTSGTSYVISMGKGNHSTGSQRYLERQAGEETIRYDLCQDSSCNTIWGGTGELRNFGPPLTGKGSGTSVYLPVYGRAFPFPSNSVGTYTDTVIVTLSY